MLWSFFWSLLRLGRNIFFHSLSHNLTALGSGIMFSFHQSFGDRFKMDLQYWKVCAGISRGTAKSVTCLTSAAWPCHCQFLEPERNLLPSHTGQGQWGFPPVFCGTGHGSFFRITWVHSPLKFHTITFDNYTYCMMPCTSEHKVPYGLFEIYIYLSYMWWGNGNDNSYWMVSKDILPTSQRDQISKSLS